MTPITQRLASLQIAAPQGGPLTLVPILGASADAVAYDTLTPETLADVAVSEISEGGSVPELLIDNGLDCMIFLLDGQELVGAKQNRILNTDVLVAAKSQIKLPVSCVEQNRWGYRSRRFRPGSSASYRSRRRKSSRVHESLKREGRHDADQREVWREVREELAASQTPSPTAALSDAYTTHADQLQTFRQRVVLPDDTIGLAAFWNGQFLGLDLFDSSLTMRHFWPLLVDSYALGFMARFSDQDAAPGAPGAEVQVQALNQMFEAVASVDWESFNAVGEGEDFRLEHPTYSGSALIHADRAVHMQVFPREEPVLS